MIKNILIYLACILIGIVIGITLTLNGKIKVNDKPILCFVPGGVVEQ